MAYKQQVTFKAFPVSSLSEEQQLAHLEYLEAKQKLSQALQSSAPKGYRVLFSEKYGTPQNPQASQMRLAAVPLTGAKQPQSSGQSLEDFLDEYSNGLHRA